MENIKEKLKQGLKQISKHMPKQLLSGDELTEVSGGEGVREFVGIGPDLPKEAHMKVEVDKDGFVTFTVHAELSGREVRDMKDHPGLFD